MMPAEIHPGGLVIFTVIEGLSLAGIVNALVKISRIERSKVIWGKITAFSNLGEPERKPYEDPQEPDFLIEVEYEYEGVSYTDSSVIKKEIHYEVGEKIKVFVIRNDIANARVNYNVRSSAYIQLITSIFLAIFFLWLALLRL